MKLSYSALKTFRNCHFQYHLRYNRGLPSRPRPTAQSSKALHGALHLFHQDLRIQPAEQNALLPSAMAAFPWPVPFLRKDEARSLQGRIVLVEGKIVDDDLLFDILRPTSEYVTSEEDSFRPTLTIEFETVRGQRYFVEERLLYEDIEIVQFGPVTTPYSSKLWATGRELWAAGQKLWVAGQQQRQRKKKRASDSTALDAQAWVDGR